MQQNSTPDSDPEPSRLGSFDYVIVGAGPSAMGLIHGLLMSSSSTSTVALVERGTDTNDALTQPLERWCAASHDASCASNVIHTGTIACSSSFLNTNNENNQQQKFRLQRVCDVSVGMGLGGTTLINAGLVIPPAAADFKTWPDLGNSHLESDGTSSNTAATSSATATIMASVDTVLQAMHAQGCVQSTTVAASSRTPIQTTLPIVDNNQSERNTAKNKGMWNELIFPSTCLSVPCAAKQHPAPSSSTEASKSPKDTSSNNKNGMPMQRASYFESLVQPLLVDSGDKTTRSVVAKERLTIFTGYAAERILFVPTNSNKTNDTSAKSSSQHTSKPNCRGVEVQNVATGQWHTVVAIRDVILCAGALESPALLLAAGIGRPGTLPVPSLLRQSDDRGTANARGGPFVGGKLFDHVILPRIFLTRPTGWNAQGPQQQPPLALNGVRAMANVLVPQQLQQSAIKKEPTKAQISLMDAAAYMDLVPLMVADAARFRVVPVDGFERRWLSVVNGLLHAVFVAVKTGLYVLIAFTPVYYLMRYCIATMAVFLMNAESVGTLRVVRKEPSTVTSNMSSAICRRSDLDLDIDLAYLHCDNDILRFMQAWEACGVAYPAVGLEIFPGPLVRSFHGGKSLHLGRFATYARSFVLPYFHWMGTCAMQIADNNDDWVVDADFRVRGVDSLRVCDASVFPTLISAPPALTCAALGHVLASKLASKERK